MTNLGIGPGIVSLFFNPKYFLRRLEDAKTIFSTIDYPSYRSRVKSLGFIIFPSNRLFILLPHLICFYSFFFTTMIDTSSENKYLFRL